MGGRDPGRAEEDQVPGSGTFQETQSSRDTLLIGGITREPVSLFSQEELYQAGAVDPGRRAATPEIGDAEQIPHPSDQAGRLAMPDDQGTRFGPAPPAVRKLDLPVAAPRAARDHSIAPHQRADERAPSGLDTRLGPDPGHPGTREAPPRRGPARGYFDQPPGPHPSPVVVRLVLDQAPRPTRSAAPHPDHLPQQQLAAHLAPVPGSPAHVQRGETHDAIGRARGGHSTVGLRSVNRPKPSRSPNTKRR